MPNGLIKELREVEPATLPERDVRAGRPVLSGILRFDTVRALARVLTLSALDLAGLFLAIYTALQTPGGDALAARLAAISFTLGLMSLLAAELIARRVQRALGRA